MKFKINMNKHHAITYKEHPVGMVFTHRTSSYKMKVIWCFTCKEAYSTHRTAMDSRAILDVTVKILSPPAFPRISTCLVQTIQSS